MTNSESGNILWFILVAVVLLGALTGILSRGGSSTDQSGEFETMNVRASQILRYAKSIETAIEHMVLQGISENDISFQNTFTAIDYTNAGCNDAADSAWPGCMVFHTKGGGLEYRSAPQGSAWIFTGANNVGTDALPVGTTAASTGNDIIMLLPGISTELCVQINRELNIGTPGTIPEDSDGILITEFTGSYPGGGPSILDGDPTPFELNGHNAGCFTDANAGITYFYYVVLAR